MADREKVIRGLVEISDHMQQVAEKSEDPSLCGMFEYWHEMAEDALALLREHEPVKPVWFLGPSDPRFHCGACRKELPDSQFRFCPWCGREVKWDD